MGLVEVINRSSWLMAETFLRTWKALLTSQYFWGSESCYWNMQDFSKQLNDSFIYI